MSAKFDLPKIEQLMATAETPKQKAMYQALLEKAKLNQTQMQSEKPQPIQPKSSKTDSAPPKKVVLPKQEKKAEEQEANAEEVPNEGLFQALGILKGQVNLSEDGENSITIGGKQYQLFYLPHKRKAFEALSREIAATQSETQRLIVYPKVIHFPKRDQPHRICFQLVGFDNGQGNEGVHQVLNDGEFRLSGLWQFIPVCRTPCVSIFRNFTEQRLEYIKSSEPSRRVKFLKSSHVPLLWRDAPAKPFRFNPRGEKDQGKPAFVQVKAKFLPGRDVFGFVEQLAAPTEQPPRFLKASKKDKAEVQQAKANRK